MLDALVSEARNKGASDLHLEAGLPAAMRIRGALRVSGQPMAGQALLEAARGIIGARNWNDFVARRSFDGSKVLGRVHCRLSIFQTARGIGMAIRLLSGFQPTLERLNLHPEIGRLAERPHGLLLICGPTGSGKSSTLAALIEHLNQGPAKHIITIEDPIEYRYRPHKAFIRQREVGRDTPSFEQALLDALREDPDVLMVGEMRRRETMQLTLEAAETGHLVLATLHSSTTVEALQRLVSAFAPEAQASVRSQLAGCLVGVVAQRLVYRDPPGLRVPECEILTASSGVRGMVREGRFLNIQSAIETGASQYMWTFERYRGWLDGQRSWSRRADGDVVAPAARPAALAARPVARPEASEPAPLDPAVSATGPTRRAPAAAGGGDVDVLEGLIAALEGRK